jgi:hypothetical protein
MTPIEAYIERERTRERNAKMDAFVTSAHVMALTLGSTVNYRVDDALSIKVRTIGSWWRRHWRDETPGVGLAVGGQEITPTRVRLFRCSTVRGLPEEAARCLPVLAGVVGQGGIKLTEKSCGGERMSSIFQIVTITEMCHKE